MKKFPERVVLCGIGYTIQESEGMVIFSEEAHVWGTYSKLAFTREPHGCWYVEILDSREEAMVNHILEAYKLVEEYRGKNHE